MPIKTFLHHDLAGPWKHLQKLEGMNMKEHQQRYRIKRILSD